MEYGDSAHARYDCVMRSINLHCPGVSPLLAQLAGTRRYLDIMINGSSLDWVATPPARYHTALNIKIHILNSTSIETCCVFLFTFLAADSFYSYQQSFLHPSQRTPVNCRSEVTPESRAQYMQSEPYFNSDEFVQELELCPIKSLLLGFGVYVQKMGQKHK